MHTGRECAVEPCVEGFPGPRISICACVCGSVSHYLQRSCNTCRCGVAIRLPQHDSTFTCGTICESPTCQGARVDAAQGRGFQSESTLLARWIPVVLDALSHQIEDRCFKAPIQMFSDSKTFRAMLETATTNDPDARRGIHLDEISKDEFLYFMRFMNQRFVVPERHLISPSHAK